MNSFSVEAGNPLSPQHKYVLIQAADETLNNANEYRRNLLLESMALLTDQIAATIRVHLRPDDRDHALDPVLSVGRHARKLRADWDNQWEREQLHTQVARISTALSKFDEPEDGEGPLYGESRVVN